GGHAASRFDKPSRAAALSSCEDLGECFRQPLPSSDWVFSVAFSADRARALSGGWDGTIKLWDASGALIRSFVGHSGLGWSVVFSAAGACVLWGSDDKTIKLWDAATGR